MIGNAQQLQEVTIVDYSVGNTRPHDPFSVALSLHVTMSYAQVYVPVMEFIWSPCSLLSSLCVYLLRSTTIWLTGPLCFFHPCRQRTPPISTERFGSEAILSSAARRCRSGRKQSNQARVMVSSGLPHRCCFIRPILPRKTRRPSSSFAETFAASMETVKIPTDELLEAMLKKLGLPCPRYDNKHAGGGCFEVTLTYYPPWHYLQSLIPPHSLSLYCLLL
ncbi:uncharacterized protein [Lolium perenne]|uniref:uncharacterized protein isoform X2 n=1 Tax=Lolium perenne TaxID=4522 RepID=UPI0021F520EF|nr:uncharacterized protein LOC127294874 isoform X2 [Lolium perenne]